MEATNPAGMRQKVANMMRDQYVRLVSYFVKKKKKKKGGGGGREGKFFCFFCFRILIELTAFSNAVRTCGKGFETSTMECI